MENGKWKIENLGADWFGMPGRFNYVIGRNDKKIKQGGMTGIDVSAPNSLKGALPVWAGVFFRGFRWFYVTGNKWKQPYK
jgi:hypothetical protein